MNLKISPDRKPNPNRKPIRNPNPLQLAYDFSKDNQMAPGKKYTSAVQ